MIPQAWLSLAEAERLSGINQGVISRAINAGAIRSNGLTGKGRPKLTRQTSTAGRLDRTKRPERTESDTEVERKLRRHGND